MAVQNFQVLQEKVSNLDKDMLYVKICKNIKIFRLEKYKEFKKSNNYSRINPYSTENIAALLDYNHNHYKRFESENDSTKKIPLDKLIKLSIISDKNLEDFLK